MQTSRSAAHKGMPADCAALGWNRRQSASPSCCADLSQSSSHSAARRWILACVTSPYCQYVYLAAVLGNELGAEAVHIGTGSALMVSPKQEDIMRSS